MLSFHKPAPKGVSTHGFVKGNTLQNKRLKRFDDAFLRSYNYLFIQLGKKDTDRIWAAGQKIHDLDARMEYYSCVILQVEQATFGPNGKVAQTIYNLETYQHVPVGIKEFICSPKYLNKEKEIYPAVLEAAEELNNGTYVEAILVGGIGAAKTTLALFTNCYQLYLLSCMRSPHKLYKLDPSSEILMIFQSINKQLAKGVDYDRFRSMIEGSPYFKNYFPFDKNITSKLVFPNRIEVIPVSGSETAAIGQNVIGGLIDELNYMAVVEKSKSSVDKGTYDQAVSVYNSIARRRKSRFLEDGKMPGILCLVSSKKYPGQFTDQKMEEASKDSTIFVYDKRVWDIKPDSFTKGWFHVFPGDLSRKPRILLPEEEVSDKDRDIIVPVPEEFRVDFEKDIINALREIAGVSTMSRHPFFLEVEKLSVAFQSEVHSIFSQSPVDFVDTRLTLIRSAFFKPELPRFCHVDLALTGDSAGFALGTVTGFINVAGNDRTPAYMPQFRIDGVLEIRPPRNSEILFSKIRQVIFTLRNMGFNIRWVTFDQFQSNDSQQILKQHGIVTGHQSMDEVPSPSGTGKVRGQPYDYLKGAFYEGRITLPLHPHLQKEILMLEKDTKTGKIDHPPGFSKDTADALAGVVFGLTMRREIWGLYSIPITMIPNSIQSSGLDTAPSIPQYQEDIEEMSVEERIRKRAGNGINNAFTTAAL